MFGFRIRSPQRDRDADRERQRRLINLIDSILSELHAECAGLEQRYRTETERAGFLVEALTNEEAEPTRWGCVDQITTSIVSYEKRVISLASQIEILEEFRQRLQRSAIVATDDQ